MNVTESIDCVTNGKKSVLLVEDDEAVRHFLASLLEKRGYQVLVAENGYRALLLATRHQGAIDLLLTDVSMPVMDGVTSARIIKLDRPSMRVLYMSASSSRELGLKGHYFIHESDLIRKPFDADLLWRRVEEALAGPESGDVDQPHTSI